MPRRASSSTTGWQISTAHLLDQRRVGALDRRERAHPARVRAGVALADALEVARRGERERGLAVAEREHGELDALQELLDDDRRVAEAVLHEHVHERRPRLVLVGRDHDALARREPVGLQRDGIGRDRGEAGLDGRRRPCAPRSARPRPP